MAVMRRGATWSFAVWIPANDGAPAQSPTGRARSVPDQVGCAVGGAAFLIELEDCKAYAVDESDPKTRSSRRRISLDARVIAVLRAHRRRQLEERLAWGAAWTDTGYVFTREDG